MQQSKPGVNMAGLRWGVPLGVAVWVLIYLLWSMT